MIFIVNNCIIILYIFSLSNKLFVLNNWTHCTQQCQWQVSSLSTVCSSIAHLSELMLGMKLLKAACSECYPKNKIKEVAGFTTTFFKVFRTCVQQTQCLEKMCTTKHNYPH